tara:strand:- start:992 stop:1900 length:909 start_codon:yes stop_codon:yes gene_type:complete
MSLNIINETDKLVSVILGIANDMGKIPTVDECIDPKTKLNLLNNTYPLESDCINEIKSFSEILKKYDVKVLRPNNIKGLNQIFTRDISFVVENKIFIPEIIESRNKEKDGIKSFLDKIHPINRIYIPKNIKIEGGDIILYNDYIFIGLTSGNHNYKVSRTSRNSIDFLKDIFPKKNIIGMDLIKDDNNPKESILHLDCTMQPIGNDKIIIYEEGFENKKDVGALREIFGKNNFINIGKDEMYEGCSNVFSINSKTIVSDVTFKKLNKKLEKLDYIVEKVYYREVSKFGGLFRCSTLPLKRVP